jgi:hypothetical protein
VVALDDDLIDHRGQLVSGGDPAGSGQMGVAHPERRLTHKLAQETQSLMALLRELKIL